MSHAPEPDDPTPTPITFDTLPFDAARSVLEHLDATTLESVRRLSGSSRVLVDTIAADLLAQHMQECRERAARRTTFLPRGGDAAFVGSLQRTSGMKLLGGMSCAGGRQLPLHGHTLGGGARWVAASYCGRQVLLVRSDGALIGHGAGMQGPDAGLSCSCDAEDCVIDAGGAEAEAEDDDEEDEEAALEQEEEAQSRGWGWRRPTVTHALGLGAAALPLEALHLALPEAAAAACACPGRSFVLGRSGAVYSARWHGPAASRSPSAGSPWTRWAPSSAGEIVLEISAIASHVLLRSSSGRAMGFGDPHEGSPGFFNPSFALARTFALTLPSLTPLALAPAPAPALALALAPTLALAPDQVSSASLRAPPGWPPHA